MQASTKNVTKIMDEIRDRIGPELNVYGKQNLLDDIIIAMDEAITNIIMHSYKFDEKNDIELAISMEEKKIVFDLYDTGTPLDVINMNMAKPISKDLEAREKGGLGLFLIRRLMDTVIFDREGNRNHLRLEKLIL